MSESMKARASASRNISVNQNRHLDIRVQIIAVISLLPHTTISATHSTISATHSIISATLKPIFVPSAPKSTTHSTVGPYGS